VELCAKLRVSAAKLVFMSVLDARMHHLGSQMLRKIL